MPTALNITIPETLGLFDGLLREFADRICDDAYSEQVALREHAWRKALRYGSVSCKEILVVARLRERRLGETE